MVTPGAVVPPELSGGTVAAGGDEGVEGRLPVVPPGPVAAGGDEGVEGRLPVVPPGPVVAGGGAAGIFTLTAALPDFVESTAEVAIT